MKAEQIERQVAHFHDPALKDRMRRVLAIEAPKESWRDALRQNRGILLFMALGAVSLPGLYVTMAGFAGLVTYHGQELAVWLACWAVAAFVVTKPASNH